MPDLGINLPPDIIETFELLINCLATDIPLPFRDLSSLLQSLILFLKTVFIHHIYPMLYPRLAKNAKGKNIIYDFFVCTSLMCIAFREKVITFLLERYIKSVRSWDEENKVRMQLLCCKYLIFIAW